MSNRIWPGALCEVRGARQTPEINGRFVIAVRIWRGGLVDGCIVEIPIDDRVCWVIRAAVDGASLPWDGYENFERVMRERCLYPILPPPGTDITDTDVPADAVTA